MSFNSFPQPKPDSGGSNIKSIQRGTTLISGVTSVNVPISTVDVKKTIVLISMNTIGEDVGQVMPMVVLLDSNTIQITKTSATNGANVNWQVIEFVNVKSKQTGNISLASATMATATVSSVNTSKSILLFTFRSGNSGATIYGAFMLSELTNPTTITISNNVSVAITGHYQLIEFY